MRRRRTITRVLGIIGVGLIGGSVGIAARSVGWRVLGLDREPILDEAIAVGAVDEPGTIADMREADLIVLATPVSEIVGRLSELSETGVLVTDVGSTKARIVRAAYTQGIPRFVGGHPMAGSHQSGVTHATAGLFRGARYFLTPTDETDAEAYGAVAQFVQTVLGASPTAVPPEKHDVLIAALSHLPHLVAVALLGVASEIAPETLSFAGPSFRDLTRVGSSNPDMWSDILAENEGALREVLERFAAKMGSLGAGISERDEIARQFIVAGEAYATTGGVLPEHGGAQMELAVSVANRPGALAEVTTLLGSHQVNILDLYVEHSGTDAGALVLTLESSASDRAKSLLTHAGFTILARTDRWSA